MEGYLLSCIDGKATVEELADLSGMPIAAIEAVIRRLAELGAVVLDEAPGGSAGAPRVPRPPSGVREPPSAVTVSDENVDLTPERREKVVDTFARLDRLDHYALLGVPDTADKSEVRAAYFALSKLVHPDTMYGRQLGSYKAKMEAIFRRATEAYEVLSKRKQREQYDASMGLPDLETRLAAREHVVATPPATAAPVDAGRTSSVRPRPSTVEVEARQTGADSAEARFPRPSTRVTPPSQPRVEATRPASSPGAERPSADPARQKAQQRILQQIAQMTARPATTPVPPRASPTPPSAPTPPTPSTRPEAPLGRESILRGLAGSLREAGRLTGTERLEKILRMASTAEASGDLVGALNLLRGAIEAAPDRGDVAAEYRRLRFALAKSQADAYESQAVREERVEMWGAAALSWSRVAEGRPDSAVAHRRAAHCILISNGDMKRARDLAQRAVELAPRDTAARVTLAQVYLAAAMPLNARRELEAAAKLDPKDEFVKNLLREMKS